ncbi:MAG: hypothetical protein MK081_00230 [Flavobacteriales bacterium]|nr:hypothetical protein [Flavobacteriales bacterium]
MKTNFLLSNQYKRVGWFVFIPGLLLGIFFLIFQHNISLFDFNVFSIANQEILSDSDFLSFTENNILDEISSILIIIGGLLIAFSKEKSEDEYLSKIRLESLVWAMYVNYTILLLAIISFYGMTFLWILMFNMFTLLIFFLIRFNWVLYKSKRQISDEE